MFVGHRDEEWLDCQRDLMRGEQSAGSIDDGCYYPSSHTTANEMIDSQWLEYRCS